MTNLSFSLLNKTKRKGAIFALIILGMGVSLHAHSEGLQTYRADAHAPSGISGDHLHRANEFMLGYLFMDMRMEGLRMGKNEIGIDQVIASGYTSTAIDMDMKMQMAHLMYAPTDQLTFVFMPMYKEVSMTMEGVAMDMNHNHGGHSEIGMRHRHSFQGWGDTQFGALFRIWKSGNGELLGSFNLSAPTGSVSLKSDDGAFTHYGMQLGSGTWDAIPGIVYKYHNGAISLGAKMDYMIRLEEKNSSGYQLGNVVDLSVWAAWSPIPSISLSTRLLYRNEGEMSGHYDGAHHHSSPPDIQRNYGGEVLSTGLGINFVASSGFFSGHRFGAEAVLPLMQDLNGIQLSRDLTLNLSWSLAF